jgi:PAS domain S-box-containing protein
VWDWNIQTGALTCSETWLDKYGYSREEAPFHISFWESMVHPDDKVRVQTALADHFAGRTATYECENRLRTKTGEYRCNLDRGRVVEWDEHGRPLRMVGADTDITDRVHNEQARAQLAAIVESSEDAIISNDLEGMIASWNRGAAQLYGYTAAEVIGRPAALLLQPERAGEMAAILARISDGTGLSRYETEHVDSSGKRILVSMTISPVCDQDGQITGASMIARDITQQKELEQAVYRLNGELEQRVQKRTAELEAALEEVRQASQLKEAFLAAVSHELRTPLTGVLGVADALELQVSGPLNGQQLDLVQTLRRSGLRLLEMINGILHYTKLFAGQTMLRQDDCKLADLGVESVRKIQAQADRKRLTVRFAIEPRDLRMIGDAEGISQLLYNLLDNAIKFTPAGGALGLSIGLVGEDQVEMVVWDTGIGVPQEQQERIFDAFIQGDSGLARHYEGIGLGLAYAQRMAKLLGGTCTVQSTPGSGSRFTVVLPSGYKRERPHTQS